MTMTTRQKRTDIVCQYYFTLDFFLQVVKITNLDNQVIQFKHFDNERSFDERSL